MVVSSPQVGTEIISYPHTQMVKQGMENTMHKPYALLAHPHNAKACTSCPINKMHYD